MRVRSRGGVFALLVRCRKFEIFLVMSCISSAIQQSDINVYQFDTPIMAGTRMGELPASITNGPRVLNRAVRMN